MKRALHWIAFLAFTCAAIEAAETPLVAVVFGEHSYRSSPQGEGRGARRYMETVENALQAAGVPYAKLKDSDVEAGRLKPCKVAIFPYNFRLPDPEQAAIERYVEAGGKIIVFYVVHPRIHKLLGIRSVGHEIGKRRDQFATIELRQDLIGELPPRVRQNSWNIHRVQPVNPDARIVGEWHDPEGNPIGEAALILSPRGAFMGHVMTAGDYANKGRMLLAVIGHLVPEVWKQASAQAIATVPRVGPLASFDELAKRIEASRVSRWRRRRARSHLANAREHLAKAERLASAGKHADAIGATHKAKREAAEAFVLSSAERLDEFRGTWIHTAYGVRDWGWRRSIRHLRQVGFNAVVPNMLWAGLAHYPSELLPVSEKVAAEGDQIAQCLRWCRRYGIQLHVWKVNYNLSHAPKEFVEQLRAEGRLQRHRNGSEIKWLCPSDPRNFELERDSMLEVVRKYDVHGIHFDYIRYPHAQACFCDGCQARFEKAEGAKVAKWPDEVLREPLKARFARWRQDQITNLVRAVSSEARRIRPGVMVSAAVFNNWESHRYSVGQDWKLWLEEGLLDFVCPMDYTTDPARLEGLVTRQVEWVNGRAPLYIGTGAWRIKDTPGLIDQLERARRLGADGFVCFHYNDPELAERRMPALAKSHTAHRTRPPHPAPRVRFEFPPGLEGLTGRSYAEGWEVTVVVHLAAEGNYAKRVRRVSGRLSIETTEGVRVLRLARVSSRGRTTSRATFRLPPGRYRLVLRGSVSFGWFSWRSFVVRSRPFEVVGREKVAAEQAKGQPPRFAGKGLRVGVATGGYGSEALLAALKKAKGIEAVPLYELTPDFLRACEVAVFPQPREANATKAETVKALRAFVAAGGGLLATHDAPGYRTHPVLIPEVCRGGTVHTKGTTWQATARHPVTEGLALDKATPHSYYDFIALAAGPKGQTVAEGLAKDGKGRGPVVVCGAHGKGRYVACGLATGIDTQDREREPRNAERRLLLNAVRWLAAKK